jgi:hypothetical protein
LRCWWLTMEADMKIRLFFSLNSHCMTLNSVHGVILEFLRFENWFDCYQVATVESGDMITRINLVFHDDIDLLTCIKCFQ